MSRRIIRGVSSSPTDRGEEHLGTVTDPGSGAAFAVPGRDGRPLRVRGVWPGEQVIVRPTAATHPVNDDAWGTLVAVRTASPHRRESPCRFDADCGGCHWLAIDPAAQRDLRRARWLRIAAREGVELAGAHEEQLTSPAPLGYRVRARMQVAADGDPPRIGFHGASHWPIVDLPECTLFSPQLAHAYHALRAALASTPRALWRDLTGFELIALAGAGALLALNPRDRVPGGWPQLGERLLQEAGAALSGVAVWLPARDPRPAQLGAAAVLGHAPRGLPVAAAVRGFVQANLGAAEALAARLAGWIDARSGPAVEELFAGSGLFGWALADAGAVVHATERDPLAVQAAALLPQPAQGRFTIATSPATARLALVAQPRTIFLADPPRSGLGAALPALIATAPDRVLLIWCAVQAAARDLAQLQRAGYRLERWLLAEFYPGTWHSEIAALLIRRDRRG